MKKRGATLKRFYAAIHDDLIVAMGSLIILTVVDLVSINIFFLSISVDALTAAQFIALGAVAVLFKVRARARHQNLAWFFWALITFFGGLMFTLNTVVIQGEDAKPEYVIRAETDYMAASDRLDDLLAQQKGYRDVNRRSLAIEMEPSVTAARDDLDSSRRIVVSAEERWAGEPKKKIKAIDIFARIPYVFRNPSAALFIAAAFFIVLYLSVEASIWAIAGEIGKPIDKKQRSFRAPKAMTAMEDHFGDVTDDEYRMAAEYTDGSVRLPEEVARSLKISRDEADRIHARIYAGYIYRDGRYARIRGVL